MLDKTAKILIVDDFEVVRLMLKTTLEEIGYKNIEIAEDGQIALNSLKNAINDGKPFDIVFTDWNMPNLTGIQLLETCKKDANLKKIPIVMITAESDESQVIQALRAGASEFIVKPFSQDALRKKIEKLNKRISGA